jgi:hypothetical protein
MGKTPPESGSNLRKTIIILLGVILLAFLGWYFWMRDKSPAVTDNSNQGTLTVFQGKVTGINNGCNHDDVCSVTVEGKTIITGGGLTSNEQTNTYGIVDADLNIGDEVKVRARNTSSGMTLQGCSDCYITRGSIRGQ